MARHNVKCFYCGVIFDCNSEPYVKVNSQRYAHEECHTKHENAKTKEEKDKDQLERYIKELFNCTTLSPKIKRQIKQYKEELNYSYSAIYKTLKYWFEVKKGDIEKANGGIGIVPYIVEDARNYWLDIMQARELNKELTQQKVELPTSEVHILPPQRVPIRRLKKKFTFLEEDEEF